MAALLLASARGRDSQRYEVQIKGGGLTPFSRMATARRAAPVDS